jgi:hypothetical protein
MHEWIKRYLHSGERHKCFEELSALDHKHKLLQGAYERLTRDYKSLSDGRDEQNADAMLKLSDENSAHVEEIQVLEDKLAASLAIVAKMKKAKLKGGR